MKGLEGLGRELGSDWGGRSQLRFSIRGVTF